MRVFHFIDLSIFSLVCKEEGEVLVRTPLRVLLLLSLFAVLFAACGSSTATTGSTSATPAATAAPPVTLNVFAAASLTEAFNEMKTQSQAAHPSVTLCDGSPGNGAKSRGSAAPACERGKCCSSCAPALRPEAWPRFGPVG